MLILCYEYYCFRLCLSTISRERLNSSCWRPIDGVFVLQWSRWWILSGPRRGPLKQCSWHSTNRIQCRRVGGQGRWTSTNTYRLTACSLKGIRVERSMILYQTYFIPYKYVLYCKLFGKIHAKFKTKPFVLLHTIGLNLVHKTYAVCRQCMIFFIQTYQKHSLNMSTLILDNN